MATPHLRRVSSDEDLEAWVRLRNEVAPNEPVSVKEMRSDEEGRLLLLAEFDDMVVGCGIARRSHFTGRGFVMARVLPAFRRRGVGSALSLALRDHVLSLGRDELMFLVYADDLGSIVFAERFGQEVDYRLQQVRTVGVEEPVTAPEGINLVALHGRRDELLRAAWPLSLEGHEDMPLPGDVTIDLDEWLRDEATRPGGSFVALHESEVVGFAGLREHADGPTVAEHGLTVVRRDYRRRGIAYALKRAQLRWAADEAAIQQLVTWTQKGNEPMQTLNRRLGYADHARVLVYVGAALGADR